MNIDLNSQKLIDYLNDSPVSAPKNGFNKKAEVLLKFDDTKIMLLK
jgi:hypothetical protein